MSNRLLRNLMWVHTLAIVLFFGTNLSAANFTAVADGNWSSSATWAGGVAPGSTITNDVIVIGSTFEVNLDQNVEINGALSSLQVDGELSTTNSYNLTLTQGTLIGTGQVVVNELMLGAGALVTFTGDITANTFTSATTSITLAVSLMVNQTLELSSGLLNIGTGGALSLMNNSTIVVDGGAIGVTGSGALNLSGNYNVVYNGTTAISGLELSGSGLNNVTINLDNAAQSVNLTSDLTVDGMLMLQAGQLSTQGNDLTLNGGFNVSGSGSITSTSASNITLTGSTGGSLAFTAGSQSVGNLTISLPSNAAVNLNSDLTVTGTFSNATGTLDISDESLTLSGNLTGNGSIQTNANSDLTLNSSANISGELNLTSTGSATAGTVGDLTIDLTGTNDINLGGDIIVSGTLELTSGVLALNGNQLALTGDLSASGTGTLAGSSTGSSVVILSSGNVSGDLTFGTTGQAQVLDELSINISNNGSISLGSNVTVNGALNLESGNLNLNGNTLTVGAGTEIEIAGGTNVMGTGNFNGSAGYNLTVSGSGNAGIGVFGTGTGLGDLTIDLSDSSSTVTIGNDVTVGGTLDLQGGTLDLNGNDLTLNGDISGGVNGSITSDGTSSISINSATSTTGGLSFSSTGNVVGTLSVDIQDGGSVSILSDLTVEDELELTSGMVVLADGDLNISAGGEITGASLDNYIVTSGEGSLGMEITGDSTEVFAVGTLDNYTPASVTSNGSANGMFSVRVAEDVLSNGTSGSVSSDVHSVVDATWFVESDITTALDVDIQVEWTSAMEVNGFNRDSAYLSHYVSGAWDADAATSATAEGSGRFSLTRTGVTSLSPFAVFDKNARVGIREVAANEDLTIYPNPAINMVNVPAGTDASASIIQIIDINGAKVIELSREAYEAVTVDVGALSNGIYFVKVIGDNTVSTGRFVKN